MKRIRTILNGPLGAGLKLSCAERLKKVDYKYMTEPFRLRNEDDGAWRCEFWGKVVRSAILTNFHLQDAELDKIIRQTVQDIMKTQTPDGCISSYPAEKQLTSWDIWGRKYVLLALLRYYDMVEKSEDVKKCCTAMVDHLMTQIGPDRKNITACGYHSGLASSSILGAIIGVYRISGEKRFLDFAEYIINTGCSDKHNIFDEVKAGTFPCNLGNGKAYEMTSCFQGLAEFYLLHPHEEYRKICEMYFDLICERELFVTGAAGGRDKFGEFWFDGAFKQTANIDCGLGETCVTVTFLHYCARMVQITRNAAIYDKMERSLYNSILGMMAPDGSHWAHVNPTPLTGGGFKQPAGDQIELNFNKPFDGHDCCRAQGPEGLGLAADLAVTQFADGIALNFFEPLTSEISDGTKIVVSGNYPLSPTAEIAIYARDKFTIYIRVAEFCKSIQLNGEPLDIQHGSYLKISRIWQSSDKLVVNFDFTVKEITPPDNSPYTAYLRGPLLLASDSKRTPDNPLLTVNHKGLHLVDYISAGKEMNCSNTLTVWHKK